MRSCTLKLLASAANFFFSVWLAGLISGTASAAVINYDESVMGELGPGPGCPPCTPPTSIGTLGVGTNTVKGHMFSDFGANAFPVATDLDSFSFGVPAGAMLEELSFAFSFSKSGALTDASIGYALNQIPPVFPNPNQAVDFFTAASPVAMFSGALPLSSGSYSLQETGGAMVCNPFPCRWDVDYVWSLVVVGPAAIPEPSSLSLISASLLAGAVVLIGRRRVAGSLRRPK